MNDAFKSWHIPLSAEAKAEAIKRITERHRLLEELGPVAFAALGRADKARYKHIQIVSHGYVADSEQDSD
jgi:hypothetical protein